MLLQFKNRLDIWIFCFIGRVKVQYIDLSCKAYFIPGAIKACGFLQLQVHSFHMTAGVEAEDRLACVSILVGNAAISACLHVFIPENDATSQDFNKLISFRIAPKSGYVS